MPPSLKRRDGGKGASRVTPYRTSQTRQEVSTPDFLPNHSPTTDQLSVVELLLSKTWRLYRVSPLCHFDTSSVRLNSCAQQLTRHLLSMPFLESGYIAKLTPLPRFGLDGSTALRIDLHQKDSDQDSTEAVIILCRVKPPQFSPNEGFVCLPLLLGHGPLKLVDSVFGWMVATFDCFISPFSLTQESLLLLAGHYANTEPQGHYHGNIELLYSTPSAVKGAGLSSVAVELPRDSVASLWEMAERKVKDEGGQQKVKETFLEMISDVVTNGTGLQLKSFTLTRISTPALHANASGLVKFLSEDVPIPVLAVLQAC